MRCLPEIHMLIAVLDCPSVHRWDPRPEIQVEDSPFRPQSVRPSFDARVDMTSRQRRLMLELLF